MSVKGLSKVLKDLEKFGREADKQVHVITGDVATQIQVDARERAPINKIIGYGKDLKQGILAVELGNADFKVTTNANNVSSYAAYMEFGTGKKVKVPVEMKKIALKFKGAGVKEVNLQPQPFLYPAFVKGRIQYIKDLKHLLTTLTKKYD